MPALVGLEAMRWRHSLLHTTAHHTGAGGARPGPRHRQRCPPGHHYCVPHGASESCLGGGFGRQRCSHAALQAPTGCCCPIAVSRHLPLHPQTVNLTATPGNPPVGTATYACEWQWGACRCHRGHIASVQQEHRPTSWAPLPPWLHHAGTVNCTNGASANYSTAAVSFLAGLGGRESASCLSL